MAKQVKYVQCAMKRAVVGGNRCGQRHTFLSSLPSWVAF